MRDGADTIEIALTFDDGPDPVYTPQVLDVLRSREAVATFFVVGASALAHPHLIERMVDEGHAIGSHTSSHTELRTLTPAQIHEEIRSGHRTVEEVAGRRARSVGGRPVRLGAGDDCRGHHRLRPAERR